MSNPDSLTFTQKIGGYSLQIVIISNIPICYVQLKNPRNSWTKSSTGASRQASRRKGQLWSPTPRALAPAIEGFPARRWCVFLSASSWSYFFLHKNEDFGHRHEWIQVKLLVQLQMVILSNEIDRVDKSEPTKKRDLIFTTGSVCSCERLSRINYANSQFLTMSGRLKQWLPFENTFRCSNMASDSPNICG